MLYFINFPAAKNSMDKRGGYQEIPLKSFRLTMPKTFAREPFCVVFHKIPLAKKIMDKRGGGYPDFPSENFCLTMPKTFAKEPFVLCFRRHPLAKKILDKKGGIKVFCRKTFVLQGRKIP